MSEQGRDISKEGQGARGCEGERYRGLLFLGYDLLSDRRRIP